MSALWTYPGWFPPERLTGRNAGAKSDPCDECGLPHTQERRLAVLRRMLPATTAEIVEAYSHLWPDRSGRTLRRDMEALGARVVEGVWGVR